MRPMRKHRITTICDKCGAKTRKGLLKDWYMVETQTMDFRGCGGLHLCADCVERVQFRLVVKRGKPKLELLAS